jgi:hypothetical protein
MIDNDGNESMQLMANVKAVSVARQITQAPILCVPCLQNESRTPSDTWAAGRFAPKNGIVRSLKNWVPLSGYRHSRQIAVAVISDSHLGQ